MNYKFKYLKYKSKYLNLYKQIYGGAVTIEGNMGEDENREDDNSWEDAEFVLPNLPIKDPTKEENMEEDDNVWKGAEFVVPNLPIKEPTKDESEIVSWEDEIQSRGIIINDQIITRISGPTCIYFLEAKSDHNYLPMIFLFGDIHHSFDTSCNYCNDINIKNCCYLIDDNKFLTLLNSKVDISKKKYIDFYIETSLETTTGFNGGFMNTFTTEPLINCFKLSHKVSCPNKDIRWHGGDVRFMNNKYIERKIHDCLDLIMSYSKNNSILTFENFIRELNTILSHSSFNNVEGFIKFLEYLGTEEIPTFDNFSRHLNDIINHNTSLILKQLNKLSLHISQKIDFINIYTESLKFYYEYLVITDNPSLEIIELLRNDRYLSTAQGNIYKNATFLMLLITSSFLDIYTVLRILKKPQDSIRPTLVLGYFGKVHIYNIRNILCMYNDMYEISYEYDNTNRCVEINELIDLNKKIYEYPVME
jgi:hypothetical protein